MKFRKTILWIDGGAGLLVGLLTFALLNWLCPLFHLPKYVIITTGSANLIYACFALYVASKRNRSLGLIVALASANLAWMFVSVGLLLNFGQQASVFGLLYFVAEGAFVAFLAYFEWKWRRELQFV